LAVLARRPDTLAGLTERLARARSPFLIVGRPAFEAALHDLLRTGRVRRVYPSRPARAVRLEVC
jgi:hypothetical protein